MSHLYLAGRDLEINEMGKIEVTVYIRGGAKVGDRRQIGTPEGVKIGTVKKSLIFTIPPVFRQAGGKNKRIMPAKNYYRVELD